MERLNLSRAAVAGWLVPGTMIGADDIALRWAGMPNKNERALVTTVLEALADAAFLQRLSPGTYAVVRPSGEGYQ